MPSYTNPNKDWQNTVASPSGAITSSTFVPVPSTQYQTPTQVPVYPVGSIPTMQITQPEQQAQDLTSQIQSLNDSLTGQSDYRAQQEAQQGISAKNQTITDLTSRLTALKNEALAIPLQLQQDATGRGVTTGGLQPIQTAALRNNAIQSLSTNSLLEAAQGNLASAMNMVDRAVAQKYDPIKEQIAAKTANLDLILKSPAYTLADKNRAAQQKAIQDAQSRALDQQKEDYGAAQALAAAAVKNNPNNPEALMAAQKLLALDPASPGYLVQAFQLVGQYQTDPAKVQADLDAHLQARAQLAQTQANTALAYANIRKMQADNQVLSISDAKALGVPYGTTKAEAIAMGKVPGAAQQATELKTNAFSSAKALLDMFSHGQGTSAVGGNLLNRLGGVGDWLGQGTGRQDFIVQLNNLKALLSLDNVKYLKGQGQVSDAERRLLEQASTILDRSQTEGNFSKSLTDIVGALAPEGYSVVGSDGKTYIKSSDGSFYAQ